MVRTIGDAYPTTQVYDVYLLALENVPGWWVYMDAIKPFIDATLSDLEARNPGSRSARTGSRQRATAATRSTRPYTNETRDQHRRPRRGPTSTPARCPTGYASTRYYVAERIRARVNLDGETTPTFANDYAAAEPFTDANGERRATTRARRSPTRTATARASLGNPCALRARRPAQPLHALAGRGRRASRRAWPRASRRTTTPTWRLLLDRMIADPTRYHNAIFVNLHGELLPMPAVRNYSDAAKDPTRHAGLARGRRTPSACAPARARATTPRRDVPALARLRLQDRVPDDRAR